MVRISQQERDLARRETVERYHILKDAEEQYELDLAAATSDDDRQQVMDSFASFRQRHHEEDIERGKRAPGFAIQMHQIIWARWIEIAAAHLAAAELAYAEICGGDTSMLVEELRQSLVTIAAAASTVEAVYEDARYLLPERKRRDSAAERIADCLVAAFGLSDETPGNLLHDLTWLFDRRNEGLHPNAEPEAPQPHPSGVNTGPELSRFNALESCRALRIALQVLDYAASPPKPLNRSVARWVTERRTYHEMVVAPIRAHAAA